MKTFHIFWKPRILSSKPRGKLTAPEEDLSLSKVGCVVCFSLMNLRSTNGNIKINLDISLFWPDPTNCISGWALVPVAPQCGYLPIYQWNFAWHYLCVLFTCIWYNMLWCGWYVDMMGSDETSTHCLKTNCRTFSIQINKSAKWNVSSLSHPVSNELRAICASHVQIQASHWITGFGCRVPADNSGAHLFKYCTLFLRLKKCLCQCKQACY